MTSLKMKNGNELRIQRVKKLPNGWEQAFIQIKIEGGATWGIEKAIIICGKGNDSYILVNGEKFRVEEFSASVK